MNFIEKITDDLNKSVLNGIDVGQKNINKTIDSVENQTQKGLNTGFKFIDNNLTKIESKSKKMFTKIDNKINKNINKVLKTYNDKIDVVNDTTNKNVNFFSKLNNDIINGIYVFLFNILIKPLDPKIQISYYRSSFLYLFIGFFILLLTTINNFIVKNSFEFVISLLEKFIGYRLDGRRIGPERKPQPSKKYPMVIKILKSILMIIAKTLDIVLMAFTSQVDVFANIVENLIRA
jgi:hypothetical protein